MVNPRNIIRGRLSKRLTLHKRHKIERKVREHGRKLRKENALNGQKRSKKDPGIPNMWPFKDEMLAKIEAAKLKAKENVEQQKMRRQREVEKSRKLNMGQLAADANRRAVAFNNRDSAQAQLELKDNSRKAYFKEFKKVLEASDVILEVLDARDPLGCRCLAIEQFIQGKYPTKKIIVVLNKVDLVPREVVEAWLRHLRLELPAVAFKCSTQNQRQNLGQAASNALTPHAPTAECLGADTLLQLLKNYARNLEIKTSITVGIIGYPNVGKSSLINSLKRSKVVGVAASAGSTKAMQEIHLDKHIKLLDCPGIVFATEGSEADVALRNAVRVESLADPIAPVEAIVRRCRPEQLQQLYAIPAFSTPQEFLVHVAKKKGKLKKGGVPDYDATARTVLQDWNGGKIPFYTTPPAPPAGTHVSAAVVASWGREFSLGEVVAAEARDVLAALPATAAGALQLASAQPVLDTGMAAEMMKTDDASIEEAEEVEADAADEAEDAEVDGAPLQPPGPRGPAAQQKLRGQKLLAGAEAEANPQVNRDRKKALKQQKKLLRKGKIPAADAGEDEDDGEEGDPMTYKFEEDY